MMSFLEGTKKNSGYRREEPRVNGKVYIPLLLHPVWPHMFEAGRFFHVPERTKHATIVCVFRDPICRERGARIRETHVAVLSMFLGTSRHGRPERAFLEARSKTHLRKEEQTRGMP
jgi:hypothetical protein